MRRALVAANWKMHGTQAQIERYLGDLQLQAGVEVVLLPPTVYLPLALQHAPTGLACGAQNISDQAQGAYTGEVAAEMVADIGGQWVVVGHSERRMQAHESDELVARKAVAAIRGGLKPIICVGETLDEREAGQEQHVVSRQLKAVTNQLSSDQWADAAIGYEPVWAIGTGQTATPAQAQQMHGFIRAQLAAVDAEAAQKVRILYGGSVKPSNALELFTQQDIDGGLVGGASMQAEDFSAIIAAAATIAGQ